MYIFLIVETFKFFIKSPNIKVVDLNVSSIKKKKKKKQNSKVRDFENTRDFIWKLSISSTERKPQGLAVDVVMFSLVV